MKLSDVSHFGIDDKDKLFLIVMINKHMQAQKHIYNTLRLNWVLRMCF